MTNPEQPEQIDREAANSILYCAIPDSFTVHGQFKLDLAAVAEALAAHRRLGIEQGKRMAGGEVERLREALEPFAECCVYIDDSEDDEEWAKFRLLIKDYRRARTALTEQRKENP